MRGLNFEAKCQDSPRQCWLLCKRVRTLHARLFLENVTTLHARVRQLSSSRNSCSKSNMDNTNKNSNETLID